MTSSTQTFDEQIEYLERLLQRVTETGLTLEPISKCQFLRRQVTYLGQTISTERVSCQAGEAEHVQGWTTPRTATELRSFRDFSSYYRRLINGLAKIAGPLHDLVNETRKSPTKKTASESNRWDPSQEALSP